MRLAVTTLLSLALAACHGRSRLESCLDYDDSQTIADCADHLRSTGAVDEAALGRFVDSAVAKFALKSGSKLQQQQPAPAELCFETRLVDASPVGTNKPLLLYLVGSIPAFRRWHAGATPDGRGGQLLSAYSDAKVRRFNARIKKACKRYHSWLTSNLMLWGEDEPERFAVAMDPTLWCPDSFVDLVVTVVAELAESSFAVLSDQSAQRIYRLKWAVWKDGSHGQVPTRFTNVFL